jgi:hypothetical protein
VRRSWLPALTALAGLVVTGCAAPFDDDGEVRQVGAMRGAPAPAPDAIPVVVDTDLGGDDLVALAFLLRHPAVSVEGVTIAATGLVGCEPGADLVGDLLRALGEEPLKVACGRAEPGPGGRSLPQEWRDQAATGTGLPRSEETLTPTDETAPHLIGRLAETIEALTVVALGPLTNLGELADQRPGEYARLAGVHAMAGAIDVAPVDGVAEWNAAADPGALAAVLAGPTPVTLVTDDAIPGGEPEALGAPVVGNIAAAIDYPKWWDLATAAALVVPDAAGAERGAWAVDGSGLLSRVGGGAVRVVRSLDAAALEAAYERAFG